MAQPGARAGEARRWPPAQAIVDVNRGALGVQSRRPTAAWGPSAEVDQVGEHLGNGRHDLPAARRAHGQVRGAVAQAEERRHIDQARSGSMEFGRPGSGSNQIIPFERRRPVSGTMTFEPKRLTAVVSATRASGRDRRYVSRALAGRTSGRYPGWPRATRSTTLESPRIHRAPRVTTTVGPDPPPPCRHTPCRTAPPMGLPTAADPRANGSGPRTRREAPPHGGASSVCWTAPRVRCRNTRGRSTSPGRSRRPWPRACPGASRHGRHRRGFEARTR